MNQNDPWLWRNVSELSLARGCKPDLIIFVKKTFFDTRNKFGL